MSEDLEAAESAEGLRVGVGDVLLVRPAVTAGGSTVPWDATAQLAGLHYTCAPWLPEHGVAPLGCDGPGGHARGTLDNPPRMTSMAYHPTPRC
jgi:Putative cyclase